MIGLDILTNNGKYSFLFYVLKRSVHLHFNIFQKWKMMACLCHTVQCVVRCYSVTKVYTLQKATSRWSSRFPFKSSRRFLNGPTRESRPAFLGENCLWKVQRPQAQMYSILNVLSRADDVPFCFRGHRNFSLCVVMGHWETKIN